MAKKNGKTIEQWIDWIERWITGFTALARWIHTSIKTFPKEELSKLRSNEESNSNGTGKPGNTPFSSKDIDRGFSSGNGVLDIQSHEESKQPMGDEESHDTE